MNEEITLESLIQEQKERIQQLQFKPEPPRSIGFSCYYYIDNEGYQKWLATTKRYLGINFPNDKDISEFDSVSREKLSPPQQKKLLAILEAFALLPDIITDPYVEKNGKDREAINVTTTINNSNHQAQNQSQEQNWVVELFIDAIKDDLTGHQIKELKQIVVAADNDLQKARPGIIDKLKSFGLDVTSNIIANILTNPIIWGGL